MAIKITIPAGGQPAPGSGRTVDASWMQQGEILSGTTAIVTNVQARAGTPPGNIFWSLVGSPVWNTINGLLVATFNAAPTAQRAQWAYNIPGPFLDPGGVLEVPNAMESIQQCVVEIEVIAATLGLVGPQAYGAAFYLNDGTTLPANGPGNGSARSSLGWGLSSTGWDAFTAGVLSPPIVWARPVINALHLNKLAIQILRPSANLPGGGIRWWCNDVKVASIDFASLGAPAMLHGSAVPLCYNCGVGFQYGIRSARFIMGPLDPSVYAL